MILVKNYAAFLTILLNPLVLAINSPLTYQNTDFNQSTDWSDTLTLTNHTNSPISLNTLQFDTNYADLKTSQLYGSIQHPTEDVTPSKVDNDDYHYRYVLPAQSAWSKTVIPANGSVNLTGIPLAHQSLSQHGVPVYYRLPFNLHVDTDQGSFDVPLQNQCENDACKDPAAGKLLGAYFTNWANYHYTGAPQNLLMPGQLPLQQLNTVFYDVGKIDATTGDVSFTDINHDQYYLPAFDTLRQQYPYLNVIYSFGGWGDAGSQSYPSYDLARVFDTQDPKFIQKVADNMVNTVRTLGINGIDIDYEWNAIQPGTTAAMALTPARAKGFMQLVADIHQDFAQLPGHYEVTAALFAGSDKVQEFINNGGDFKMLAQSLDYVDLMTYDFHGQFDTAQPTPDNITDFHSAMKTDHHYQADVLNHYNVTDAVNAYLAQGIPANKIVIGIPAYTRIEATAQPVTDDNKGVNLTLASAQPAGESGSGGTTDYKCIVNSAYCWNSFKFSSNLITLPMSASGGAQTPWGYDKSQNWFLSFDNGESAKNKGQYAKQNGLGGLMVWEIDGDIPLTDANFKTTSVLYNAWLGLIA